MRAKRRATVLLTKRAEKRNHSGRWPSRRHHRPDRCQSEAAELREPSRKSALAGIARDHRPHARLSPAAATASRRCVSCGPASSSRMPTRSMPPSKCRCVPDGPGQPQARQPHAERSRMVLLRHALWRPAHSASPPASSVRFTKALCVSVSIAGRADWLGDKHLQRLLAALAKAVKRHVLPVVRYATR